MTPLATILRPGAQTIVQDAGRPGARHLGVPLSGAADRLSFALTNAAVGNDWHAPALECALHGPTLRFERDARIAVGGADMNAQLNGANIDAFTSIGVRVGDVLALGAPKTGMRAYIAVAGGVDGHAFLGSHATYLPAGIGGFEGRALKTGDILASAEQPRGAPKEIPAMLRPVTASEKFLRITRGPEAKLFDSVIYARLLSSRFTATRRADRMGVALSGPAITPPENFSMISSPVFPGTIQAPPSGAPFLLLSDAQTVGGYGRIAQLIDADLPVAGQICPGDKIWFHEVNADDARAITAKRSAYYADLLSGFSFG